jgi:hypothetical protein
LFLVTGDLWDADVEGSCEYSRKKKNTLIADRGIVFQLEG